MIKVKDGYAKLIGTTYSGSVSRVLLSNGGDHILGNSNGNIPLNNGTVNTNLNADMLDGLHIHEGRNNEVNKIVRTDISGYIQAGWINTTSGDIGAGAINKIYCSNDNYIRYKTPANFFPTLANSGNDISITVAGQNRKLTVGYATNTDTVDGEHASAFTRIVGRHEIYTSGTAPYNYIHLFRIANSNSYSTIDCEIDFRTRYHSAKIEIRISTNNPQYGVGNSSISIVKKVVSGRTCNLWFLPTVQSSNYNYYDVYYKSGAWNSGSYGITLKGSNGVLVFEHKGTNLASLPDKVTEVTNQWVSWNDIAGKPGSFNPSAHTHSWDSITGKPTSFTPSAHNHDGRYLRLSGDDTMTGQIKSNYHADSWINGCTHAIVVATYKGYNSLIAAPIKSGNVCISAWNAEDNLNFGYAKTGKTDNNLDKRMYWDAPNNNLHADYFTGHLSGTADNADKLDGTHLNGIFTAFGNNAHNITATIGGVTKSFLVNWAADSDKLDGIHANGLLTALSNSNNGVSITVGGTTKSVSNISVNYAASAGSVAWDNVTGKPSTFTPSAHTHKWADITDHITKLSQLINDKGFVTGSVSGKTITINGNSTTWSDTWRPITDDYKLGESGTSLSSLGSLTLYNDLLDRIPNTTNYYWANIKISTSSSTTTSPTVHTLTATRVCAGYNPEIDNSISCSNWFRSSGATGWYNATYQGGWYMSDTSWVRTHNGVGIYTSGQIYSSSSIRMGNIYLQNTNEINSASGIHLNYQNSGNISLCVGGGNVGIGTGYPSYKLDVNGNIHSSGTINCNALNVGSTLSIKDSVISCSASDISIESKESGYLLIDSRQVLRYDLDSIYISNKTHFGNRLGLSTGTLGINYSTDDVTVLIDSLRESSSFEFRPAMDGQLLFLKVGKLYSNTYFWCTAKNCEVIKANNFSTYLARNGRKDCFGDGCARIFIYKQITERWYEFYCG